MHRPASPCINLCKMDDDDLYCLGCWRTLDEISDWSIYTDEEKELVWQRLNERQTSKLN